MKTKTKMTRREFVAAAGGSVVTIGLPGVFVKLLDAENEALAAELRPDGKPRIPPGQHAVKTLSDMGGVPGVGKVPTWRLEITGAVEKPLTLTFADVMKLPQVTQICDVHCVTTWTLLDSKWQGVSLQAVMDLRKRHQEEFTKTHGIKLGLMSFFMKACTDALRKFPVVNASIEGDEIVYHNYQDIGIAVSTERGLMVPIIRNAENLGLAELEMAIGDFAEKARDAALTLYRTGRDHAGRPGRRDLHRP